MEITLDKHGRTAFFTLAGRFDAVGAKKVREALETTLPEETVCLGLDLAGVDYLSSAGIRVLALAHKTMKERGGLMALSGVGSYCREVLDISGLLRTFPLFDDRASALARLRGAERDREALLRWDRLDVYRGDFGDMRFIPGSSAPCRAEVLGNAETVLKSAVTRGMVAPRKFQETEYSIGLGGLGPSLEDCFGIMGEMITIGGTMVWLPTDGQDTPDFLIPRADSDKVVFHTAFNVALPGAFNERVVFDSLDENGTTLADLYRDLFEQAKSRRSDFNGVLGVAGWAQVEEFNGSFVKISPIRENAPENKEPIFHPSNIDAWMERDETPRLRGVTCLMCGIGADLTADLTGFDKDCFDAVFYMHPANVAGKSQMLHNHGVAFSRIPMPEKLTDLDGEVKRTAFAGDFMDMRHLLDNTTVTRAFLGLSYIQEFRQEKPLSEPDATRAGAEGPTRTTGRDIAMAAYLGRNKR